MTPRSQSLKARVRHAVIEELRHGAVRREKPAEGAGAMLTRRIATRLGVGAYNLNPNMVSNILLEMQRDGLVEITRAHRNIWSAVAITTEGRRLGREVEVRQHMELAESQR